MSAPSMASQCLLALRNCLRSSSEESGRGAVSGTARETTSSAQANSTAAIAGGAASDSFFPSTPPNAGPSTKPAPTAPPRSIIGRMRVEGVVQSATSARDAVILCFNSPMGIRLSSSSGNERTWLTASVSSKYPQPPPTMEACSTRFRPTRSERLPSRLAPSSWASP